MAKDYESMSVFEQLKAGLEDSVAFSKAELNLKTTELPPAPPRMGSKEVARLRRRLKMSQAIFAATLNVSPKTVQSWEQGEREPSDVALRMLQLVKDHPAILSTIFTQAPAHQRTTGRSAPPRGRGTAAGRRKRTA